MKCDFEFKENTNTMKALEEAPDLITLRVARQLYDEVEPYEPRRTGDMRTNIAAFGVKPIPNGYELGATISYAKYVYDLEEPIHWTLTGTESHWWDVEWQKRGKRIIKQAIEENKL